MHFARSRTIWLLLSLGAAFAVLAWSAQRGPHFAPTASGPAAETLVQAAESLAAGRGSSGGQPLKVVSGVDTFTLRGIETTCATYTWGGAMHPIVTVSPCVTPGTGQVQLRQLP